MSRPKDRTGKTLRKCPKALREHHRLAVGGGWREEQELASLIGEVEKAIVYRELQPGASHEA